MKQEKLTETIGFRVSKPDWEAGKLVAERLGLDLGDVARQAYYTTVRRLREVTSTGKYGRALMVVAHEPEWRRYALSILNGEFSLEAAIIACTREVVKRLERIADHAMVEIDKLNSIVPPASEEE